MSFAAQKARPFTKESILLLEEGQYGCYGIFRAEETGFIEEWIYVGKGDIRDRMLRHFNGDNACILKGNPTHFVGEVTGDSNIREKQLIDELKPSCNQMVG